MVEVKEIEALLNGGLETEVFPRADDSESFQAIITRLQTSDKSVESKLVIAGFTLEPIDHHDIEQACETCMYYLVNRKWCELPELDLPVEPEWSCRVWRI
ncbi:MAG: hypothetical protein AAGF92_15695 [Myxococcota bacterium]